MAGRLRVDMLHAKNRSERVLPIPDPVAEILCEYRAGVPGDGPGDYVFINRRGVLFTDYGIAKMARRVWEATGLLDGRPGTKALQLPSGCKARFVRRDGGA